MNKARMLTRAALILRNGNCYKFATAAANYCCNASKGGNNSALLKISRQARSCRYYSNQTETDSIVDSVTYERVCSETLDALSDYFDELTENATELSGTDVSYGDGVLTVNLGQTHGTYVINRQTPNKQIWLSSPSSGPKRFDFVVADGKWIYKHSGESLHQLLQTEIGNILKTQTVNFMDLPYCH